LGLSEDEVQQIEKLFIAAGLPAKIRLNKAQMEKLFAAMKLDKKVSAGEIKFVLAERIGSVKWGQKVPEALIRNVLN
jgi:3-dehydroquinate synthetase